MLGQLASLPKKGMSVRNMEDKADKLREIERKRKEAFTWFMAHKSKGYKAVADMEERSCRMRRSAGNTRS